MLYRLSYSELVWIINEFKWIFGRVSYWCGDLWGSRLLDPPKSPHQWPRLLSYYCDPPESPLGIFDPLNSTHQHVGGGNPRPYDYASNALPTELLGMNLDSQRVIVDIWEGQSLMLWFVRVAAILTLQNHHTNGRPSLYYPHYTWTLLIHHKEYFDHLNSAHQHCSTNENKYVRKMSAWGGDHDKKWTPQVGLEPSTLWLCIQCSTDWATQNEFW